VSSYLSSFFPTKRYARLHLPSSGSLGSHFPTFPASHTTRPSVLRSAKTTASPSRVTSLDARSPVPRQSPFGSSRANRMGTPACLACLYTGRLSGFFSHEELTVLSSSQATPLCTCPVLSLRWCPLVCHSTARTHTFQQIHTVGFPRHHNGLSMLSI